MQRARSIVFACGLSALLLPACGGDEADQPITFEEFKSLAFQEPDTGIYVYNGDEIAEDLTDLRRGYELYLQSRLAAEGIGVETRGSIVNRVSGRDDVWDSNTARNLTYCIDQGSFTGSRYNSVVSAMNSATGAWESASSGINFIHSSSLDPNCSRRTNNVVFNVRQVCSGQYLARAFFPSSGRRSREILIDCTSFGNISPWSLTGVLRHELGHAIGLRHEHTRPESGVCFEDNNWRALNAYDSNSVMHYPQCNGSNNGDLSLTSSDRAGADALY